MTTVLDNGISVIWDLPQDQETIYVDELPPQEPRPVYGFFKRLFDIVFSFLALVVLLIPMAVIALMIVLDSPGNPIYAQTRLGLKQKPFQIYKFRSMHQDAEEDGLRWAEDQDDRVTKVGAFLRKTRLDELPQLWNILIGDMSFVGPRPERPEIAAEYERQMPEFALRLQARAGITGYAQVYGKYNTSPYDKLQLDLMYISRPSIIEDLKILFATLMILFQRESTEGVAPGHVSAGDDDAA